MVFLQLAGFSKYLPDISTAGVIPIVTVAVLAFIFLILGVIGAWFGTMKLIYNKKIIIFEKVGNRIIQTKRESAREIPIGKGGDSAFRTRRTKKVLPTPQIQTGKRVYWYYIREDLEWINFGLEDIDTVMRTAKAHFLDKEMRYARASLQKSFTERYQKISFLEKYGGLLAWTVFLVVMGIVMWLWFDKLTSLAGVAKDAVLASKEVIELSKDTLISVDNIRNGGSGIVPA